MVALLGIGLFAVIVYRLVRWWLWWSDPNNTEVNSFIEGRR